jgi:hypothetical protein
MMLTALEAFLAAVLALQLGALGMSAAVVVTELVRDMAERSRGVPRARALVHRRPL